VVVVAVVGPAECRAVVDDGWVVERQVRCEVALPVELLNIRWCPFRVASVPPSCTVAQWTVVEQCLVAACGLLTVLLVTRHDRMSSLALHTQQIISHVPLISQVSQSVSRC